MVCIIHMDDNAAADSWLQRLMICTVKPSFELALYDSWLWALALTIQASGRKKVEWLAYWESLSVRGTVPNCKCLTVAYLSALSVHVGRTDRTPGVIASWQPYLESITGQQFSWNLLLLKQRADTIRPLVFEVTVRQQQDVRDQMIVSMWLLR